MIQIDMPMPTNCLDCPACNEYLMCSIPVNGRKWGEYDVREFGHGRPEWCPMKEQEEIVRCKDCKYGDLCNGGAAYYCEKDIGTMETAVHESDWFCADGERQEGR